MEEYIQSTMYREPVFFLEELEKGAMVMREQISPMAITPLETLSKAICTKVAVQQMSLTARNLDLQSYTPSLIHSRNTYWSDWLRLDG